MRLSADRQRADVLDKFRATFEQYWDDAEFEPYDPERSPRQPSANATAIDDALARRRSSFAPYPYQQADPRAASTPSAAHGRMRNLVVAATGTGKTVIAALDYARLRQSSPRRSALLFVAHREEILEQSLDDVPRSAARRQLRRAAAVDGRPADAREHVFASIQSLHARPRRRSRRTLRRRDRRRVPPRRGDDLRAAARPPAPEVLLGLTATPERADGKRVLDWFDGRIAAELRLWDALDAGPARARSSTSACTTAPISRRSTGSAAAATTRRAREALHRRRRCARNVVLARGRARRSRTSPRCARSGSA